VAASLRLRFRGTPVRRVEEELGVAEAIDAAAIDSGLAGSATAPSTKQ
jgi:hypothetical protein